MDNEDLLVFGGVQFIQGTINQLVPITDAALMDRFTFFVNHSFAYPSQDGPDFPLRDREYEDVQKRLEEIALENLKRLKCQGKTESDFQPREEYHPIVLANAYTRFHPDDRRKVNHCYGYVGLYVRNDLWDRPITPMAPSETLSMYEAVKKSELLRLGLGRGMTNQELFDSGVDIYVLS